MRNRRMWGLIWVLAAVLAALAVGGIAAVARAERMGAVKVHWRSLAEWRDWSLGKDWVVIEAPKEPSGTLALRIYALGVVDFGVPYRGPEVFIPALPGSTPSGAVRSWPSKW